MAQMNLARLLGLVYIPISLLITVSWGVKCYECHHATTKCDSGECSDSFCYKIGSAHVLGGIGVYYYGCTNNVTIIGAGRLGPNGCKQDAVLLCFCRDSDFCNGNDTIEINETILLLAFCLILIQLSIN